MFKIQKNTILVAALVLTGGVTTAQVGINNQLPKATLDITAKNTNGSTPEGLIAPRLTGDQIKAADAQYGTAQKGTMVYATAAVTAASTKTAAITAEGYYYFDGSLWQKVANGSTYSGSSSVVINGSAFERAALSGDVTASQNSNATTIANNAVNSAKIADGTIANADLATGAGGIYKGSGSLSGNTTVTQGANSLAFTSTATNGFSVDGNTLSVDAANDRLGIGTSAPTAKLEVNNGTTPGALKIVDGTQGTGKILTSDSTGKATWETSPFTPLVLGTFPSPAVNVSGDNSSIDKYSGIYIDLPYGTWIVNSGITFKNNSSSLIWEHTYLSTSTTVKQQNGFTFLGPAGANTFYAGLLGNGIYGCVLGSSLVSVTVPSIRLYLVYENFSGSSNWYTQTDFLENYFYALPVTK